ncbi:MAG TPA: nucleotidyl transferase AbiEii/AbiGii toxin family protein [Phycisphaerae bacterium]|jgi:predicted nucleotidyltransferase component of viral defense system
MIPQANITAWRKSAPWPNDAQVEQDLVISRAIVELFADPVLSAGLALRGGMSLNKLFIQPPSRYSEDIDLVQTHAGPIGPLLDMIRANLLPWLGKSASSRSHASASLTFRFESEIAPVRHLRLKIEINTREHFSVLALQRRRLAVDNPWFASTSEVTTYQLDELMATKLRALYQRRKGRDLFDLWLCIHRNAIDADRVIACFLQYMKHEGHSVPRAEFARNLDDKRHDPAFLGDITPLLSSAVHYDPIAAIEVVRHTLIDKLPLKA